MSLIRTDHLFDQAQALVTPKSPGPLRQTDIRRACSAANYGVFHAVLTLAADQAVGTSARGTPLWGLAYRSITHMWLREVCEAVTKPNLPQRFRSFAPDTGFGTDIEAVADAVVELQELRHIADYDPTVTLIRSDADAALDKARTAVMRLGTAAARRKAFLTVVLFQPRKAG